MNQFDFIPIILGSDENAYGNVRLIHETYQIKPLLLCTRLLTPTVHSNLFDLVQIDHFDHEDVFPGALLSILENDLARSDEYKIGVRNKVLQHIIDAEVAFKQNKLEEANQAGQRAIESAKGVKKFLLIRSLERQKNNPTRRTFF